MSLSNNLTVLYPSFEHALREPDPQFHREIAALETLEIPYRVFEVEAIMEDDWRRAFRFFGDSGGGQILYRGYILRVCDYIELDAELRRRGFELITNPTQYKIAALLPEYFPYIENRAIPAVWTPEISDEEVV